MPSAIYVFTTLVANLMGRPALVPELYVSNLASSIDFYVETLGFQIEYERPEDGFVSLRLGSAWLMLEEARTLSRATLEEFEQGEWRLADLEQPFGRGMNLEIEVADIEASNARIQARNYPFLLDLHERSNRVGSRQLKVRRLLVADPDGYLIRLSQNMAPFDWNRVGGQGDRKCEETQAVRARARPRQARHVRPRV